MLDAILGGLSLGFVLALLVGPVFFMLLDISIKKGFRHAFFLSLGVVASDAFFILISVFSSSVLNLITDNKTPVGIVGGSLLIGFGLSFLLKKPHIKSDELILTKHNGAGWIEIMKGFSMNVLNPFVPLFWIGVAAGLSAEKFDSTHTIVFYSSALLTIFSTDLMKAWFAFRLKRFLNPGILRKFQILSGTGLIIFGIRLIYLVIFQTA